MEVYVNDMLVKSMEVGYLVTDLEKAFNELRHYQMKLNPSKCTFTVTLEKFLGFMVIHRGLEANLEKNASSFRNGASQK